MKAYNGPKNPFYEWPNAYAFFLFKQESANDITIDGSTFSIPFSLQGSLPTFKTTYSLAGRFLFSSIEHQLNIYKYMIIFVMIYDQYIFKNRYFWMQKLLFLK